MRPLVVFACLAIGSALGVEVDTDGDGLSDQFEQALLQKFAPRFHISDADCDVAPAEFLPGSQHPKVSSKNATIYGQVFPVLRPPASGSFIEIHFYHLWEQDCGMNAHALDAESIYALARADGIDSAPEAWRAEFWLAAAHEGTVCDMSNGARAAALGATEHGPDVWVSRDKHASFLTRALCSGGCGRDRCDAAPAMPISNLVNVGEPGSPMNGAIWVQSPAWTLASKMTAHYSREIVARMLAGAEVEIVPARDVIRGGRSTIKVAARTYGSLVSADTRAEAALESGAAGAIAAVDKSSRMTGRRLRAAALATRNVLKNAFSAGGAKDKQR